MTVTSVDELLGRDQRSEAVALVDATGREYDRHWFCTSSLQAGNFLRHMGVREGVSVGVVGAGPLALLACFGTTLLGSHTWFEPPTALTDRSVRTLVAPRADLEAYTLPPGAQRVAYGEQPTAPDVHHFEAGLWAENPSFPPHSIEPTTPLLTDGDRSITHEEVLQTARTLIDEYGIGSGDHVCLEYPLSDPRAVIAGIIAPLLAEAVIVLGGESSDSSADAEFVVTNDDQQTRTHIDPTTFSIK